MFIKNFFKWFWKKKLSLPQIFRFRVLVTANIKCKNFLKNLRQSCPFVFRILAWYYSKIKQSKYQCTIWLEKKCKTQNYLALFKTHFEMLNLTIALVFSPCLTGSNSGCFYFKSRIRMFLYLKIKKTNLLTLNISLLVLDRQTNSSVSLQID